jgi:outer membrane beta-barrel protein
MTDAQREYSYYGLSAGWNALPGEVFIGENRAYNTALYLIAGVGRTSFGGDERFTVNGGFGYRILLTDWLATHFDVRDYLYDTELTGKKKVVNNLEASLGLSFFF